LITAGFNLIQKNKVTLEFGIILTLMLMVSTTDKFNMERKTKLQL